MADAKGVKWKGKQFLNAYEKAMAKNLNRAITLIYEEVKQSISRPGRRVETVTTKTGKTRKKYGKRGEFVSAPGEPPRKQTGRLYRSLKKKVFVKKQKARVTDRGRLTERGTRHMEARPHLDPALKKLRAAIGATLTAPLTASISVGLEDFGSTTTTHV